MNNWEVLPPEEICFDRSVLTHGKAKDIMHAFISGATKGEIARVFGLKEKLVRAVIAATLELTKKRKIL